MNTFLLSLRQSPGLLFLAGTIGFLLSACEPESIDNHVIRGLKPVYLEGNAWQNVTVQEPQQIMYLGKIATYNDLLYVNEFRKGIHVIDNTNPEAPVKLAFLNIPGNTDFDFKGDVLYADNYTDLLTLRLVDNKQLEVMHRTAGLYKNAVLSYPEDYTGYFECADPSKGMVVDWIEEELLNPKCRR
jgi:hypothetical protein